MTFTNNTPRLEVKMCDPGDWFVFLQGIRVGGARSMATAQVIRDWLDENWVEMIAVAEEESV